MDAFVQWANAHYGAEIEATPPVVFFIPLVLAAVALFLLAFRGLRGAAETPPGADTDDGPVITLPASNPAVTLHLLRKYDEVVPLGGSAGEENDESPFYIVAVRELIERLLRDEQVNTRDLAVELILQKEVPFDTDAFVRACAFVDGVITAADLDLEYLGTVAVPAPVRA